MQGLKICTFLENNYLKEKPKNRELRVQNGSLGCEPN